MKPYTAEIVENLPKNIDEKMRADLIAYEKSHGIDFNHKRFSIILKNDADEAVGVLNGFTVYAEVYVDDLWVDQSCRRQGLGRLLLQLLEERFRGKGFYNINLVTSAFQAPVFYEKCGFKREFVRENVQNPKLAKTFFVKYFDEAQTQGVVSDC
ncbi:MAG: hypothetical protein S4CHLAM2_06270 [Chlamydiales bacterium]|nr:hypothetical protein [Chlamydiales bacterium]